MRRSARRKWTFWRALALVAFVPLLGLAAWGVNDYFQPLAPRPAPHPVPAETRDGRWVQDVRYLASELPRLHPGPFDRTSPQAFARLAADIERAVPALEDHEIVVALKRLVALLGDAHTTVGWPADTHFYPLWLDRFTDGFYVTAVAPGSEALLGKHLVRVGDSPVEEAAARLREIISHENEAWLGVQLGAYLTNAEVLHALGLQETRVQGRFTLEDTLGESQERVDVELQPVARAVWQQTPWRWPEGPMPLYLQRAGEDFWYTFLESGTLYFQYNRARRPLEFWRFSLGLLRALDAHPVERLVIDLRLNSGGNSFQFLPLLWQLRRHPINEQGRLFALVGPRTFSSATDAAANLKLRTNAVLFGEPTGGKPNPYGELRSFRLPNSGLTVYYSSKRFEHFEALGDAPSLYPDVTVPLTAMDYFAGRDAVLEAVLAHHPVVQSGLPARFAVPEALIGRWRGVN